MSTQQNNSFTSHEIRSIRAVEDNEVPLFPLRHIFQFAIVYSFFTYGNHSSQPG